MATRTPASANISSSCKARPSAPRSDHIGRIRKHDQYPQRRRDRERLDCFRQIEVTDDRCLSREGDELTPLREVEVFPRQIGQLRGLPQMTPDA